MDYTLSPVWLLNLGVGITTSVTSSLVSTCVDTKVRDMNCYYGES